MNGQTIAILESRARESLADLVRTRGGNPFPAPALAEVPDVDRDALAAQVRSWQATPPAAFVFQTGVGTRALFEAADALALTPSLLATLAGACVVVRGPKPTAALRSRGVRIDRAAVDPFTTDQVLEQLADVPLDGRHVVVQRYGDANPHLTEALQARGATVSEVVTYRWSLPADVAPLRALIAALARDEIDLVMFTSASQVHNLFAVAGDRASADDLRASLRRTRIASIGPVCSSALRDAGVHVTVEAHPPKLGPLMTAIEDALASERPSSPARPT
jgi:uroporphyrinogen-III synthase